MMNNNLGRFELFDLKFPFIFRANSAHEVLYYSPGLLLIVDPLFSTVFEKQLRCNSEDSSEFVKNLLQAENKAENFWEDFIFSKYEPTCLTLYHNQVCNLQCNYCFSANQTGNERFLSIPGVLSAADLVVKNCLKIGKDLTVVFHGGGEPSISWRDINLVNQALDDVSQVNGIAIRRYIATNAVMSVVKANWLTKSFDLVGISCDGPSQIQDSQRRAKNDTSSSKILERTTQILHDNGTRVHVRVTITQETINRQEEICQYICEVLKPSAIHIGPVYLGGRTSEENLIENSDIFLENFFSAQSCAEKYGLKWELSSSRWNELHGAHCNLYKQVLQLIPGEIATVCFKNISEFQSNSNCMTIGHYDNERNLFILDEEKILMLKSNYSIPKKCDTCFLKYQCSHDCPNSCLLLDDYCNKSNLCEINQKIGYKKIEKYLSSYVPNQLITMIRTDQLR